MVIGFWIVRLVPEGTPPPPDEIPLAAPIEPAIVPPGEVPDDAGRRASRRIGPGAREHDGVLPAGGGAGADAIELDVHLTSDGQLAVIHDETVDRTTDGTGAVASFTLQNLRRLDAGAPIHGRRRLHALSRQGPAPSRPWRRCSTGCPMTSGWWSRSRPARRRRRWWRRCAASRSAAADARTSSASTRRPSRRPTRWIRDLPTGYLLVPIQPFEPALRWAVEHGHAAVHPWEGDLGLDPAPALSQAAAYGRQVGCYVVNDPDRMKQLAAYRPVGLRDRCARRGAGCAGSPRRRLTDG